MQKFKNGTYKPVNPDKCMNVTVEGRNPYYRSSWEQRAFFWMDTNANVVKWGSELKKTVIQYEMPNGKGKTSKRYIPDIYVELIDKDTKQVTRYLIEVKPKRDGAMPKRPSKNTPNAMRKYNERIRVYLQNKAKWETAKVWCQKRGMIFKVFTEDTIFQK